MQRWSLLEAISYDKMVFDYVDNDTVSRQFLHLNIGVTPSIVNIQSNYCWLETILRKSHKYYGSAK